MEKRTELPRLDFAQMLFDSGWVVSLEQALAVPQIRGWQRSDEALRLSMDLGKLFKNS